MEKKESIENNNNIVNNYSPNKQENIGMHRTLKNEIIKQNKKVKVHGNELKFECNKPHLLYDNFFDEQNSVNINGTKVNMKFVEEDDKIAAKKKENTVKLNINNERGFIDTPYVVFNTDLSVQCATVDAKKEFGITDKNNKLKEIIIENGICYDYDEKKNIIGSNTYETYRIDGMDLSGSNKFSFKEIPTPQKPTDKEKEQIKYKNTQGKKLCEFLNFLIGRKEINVNKPRRILFIDNEVYCIKKNKIDDNDRELYYLYLYEKNRNGEYQLKTTIDIGTNDDILFDKKNDLLYIRNTNCFASSTRVIKRKTMDFFDVKTSLSLPDDYFGFFKDKYSEFQRIVVSKKEKAKEIIAMMDVDLFDKKQKEYFDKQVEKEQALNQGQVDKNIEKQAQISLKSKEKNTKCSIF